MQCKDKSRSISSIVVRAGLATLAFSCGAQAASETAQSAQPKPNGPATGALVDPVIPSLATWVPDSGLINIGGGGMGTSYVNLQITINSNGRFGQTVFNSPTNVGSGTVSMTHIASSWRPPSNTSFDVIIARTAVNFNVTSAIPGYSYQNNVDLGNGYRAFRITKN